MKGARIVAAVLMLALVSGCGREDTTSKGDEWKLGGEEGADMSPASDMRQPSSDMMVQPEPDMPAGGRCGDGELDRGELCDGDCPESRQSCPPPPPEACARLRYVGSAQTCDAQCEYYEESSCVDDDGCCPSSCDGSNDNDCDQPGGMCGDGVLDPGELCDGDCPEVRDCPAPPPEACARVRVVGDASMCDAQCEGYQETSCIDDDGCCPTGCDFDVDSDCDAPEPFCGDGIVNGLETCDGDCPTSASMCNDLNACTINGLLGDASMCTAECTSTPVTACLDADGCCPTGCEGVDSDCASTDLCGDPIVASATFGSASVISDFDLVTSREAGHDYDGDGAPDNGLGDTLDQLGGALGISNADVSAQIQGLINSGDLALVFEHQGLVGVNATPQFSIAILDGSPECFTGPDPAGGNFYTISPSSYDATGQPKALLPTASLTTGGLLRGQGGNIVLPLDLFGAPLEVPLRDVRVSASIDRPRTALPDKGIALQDGVLTGYIKNDDLFDAFNKFYTDNCSCVRPAGQDLVNTSGADPMCTGGLSAGLCAGFGPEAACSDLVDNCSLLLTFLPIISDVDSTNLGTDCGVGGTCDAISVGFTFDAAGARIKEVAP